MVGNAMRISDRRWSKPGRCWYIAATALNMRLLGECYPAADWTQGARDARAVVQDREDRRKQTITMRHPFPTDYPFKREPWPHQRAALDYFHGIEATAIFAEMRTGKAKVGVDHFTMEYKRGNIRSVLVLCPASVAMNWLDEVRVNCPVEYSMLVLDMRRFASAQSWVRDDEQKTCMRWMVVALESL
jgi:hypothetical protein